MIEFVIKGQIKSGKNNMMITRNGLHYPKPGFVIWRTEVLAQIAYKAIEVDNVNDVPINKPCALHVNYWKGDERRRDVSGMLDALFHCFEKAGIVTDDKLFVDVDWSLMGLDRDNPRVEVMIDVL